MAKNKKDLDLAESSKLNRISGGTNAIFNIIFILLALVCIIPVFFVFMISSIPCTSPYKIYTYYNIIESQLQRGTY